MTQYKIYAGLGGGFGGAYYQCTDDFKDKEEAEAEAYRLACECYDSQEGAGIDSYNDFLEQAEIDINRDDFDNDNDYQLALEVWADEASHEACESWINYHVIEVGSPEDNGEDK